MEQTASTGAHAMGALALGLATILVLGACDGSANSSIATPAASATPPPVRVIRVNVHVPLSTATAIGSPCDAAALRATGPIAATIPGARFRLLAMPTAAGSEQVVDPTPTPVFDGDPAAAGQGAETPAPLESGRAASQPAAKDDRFRELGVQVVPSTGVVEPWPGQDPATPCGCVFSFDLPVFRDLTETDAPMYAFSLGDVYFPIPIVPREQLQAAGSAIDIGVNPQ